jgi:hypothetical protein
MEDFHGKMLLGFAGILASLGEFYLFKESLTLKLILFKLLSKKAWFC